MRASLYCVLLALAGLSTVIVSAQEAHFTVMAELRTGARTAAVIALDLNKDQRPDIVATNQGDGTISVVLNSGGGRFKEPRSYATSVVGPYETAAADFNGDGFPDLVSANFGAARGEPYGRTVSVHLNKGDGTFRDCVDYAATDASEDKIRAVTTGDFNRDGKMDIAAAAQHSGLQVLFGKGDGTFAPPAFFSAGNSVHGIVTADFNRDGEPDVALANNGPRGRMTVVMGKGAGKFAEPQFLTAGAGTFGLDASDLNGDGFADLVTANQRSGSVSVLINRGRKGSAAFAEAIELPASGSPVAVTLGDANSDGRADILGASNSGGVIDFYAGKGDGTFAAATSIEAGNGVYDTAIADFDADGALDIACALTSGRVLVFHGRRAK